MAEDIVRVFAYDIMVCPSGSWEALCGSMRYGGGIDQ